MLFVVRSDSFCVKPFIYCCCHTTGPGKPFCVNSLRVYVLNEELDASSLTRPMPGVVGGLRFSDIKVKWN